MFGNANGWVLASGLFCALLLAVLSSPVIVSGHFRKNGNKEDAELTVKLLFGLIRYRFKVPFARFTGTSLELKEQMQGTGPGFDTSGQKKDNIDAEKISNAIDSVKDWLAMTRNLTGWVRQTLAKIEVVKWQWSTSVGTGDAMWTAMATGLLWSVKTSSIGFLSQLVRLKEQPELTVEPVYVNPAFTTEWKCIAQIRFGYAILAGLQLLVRMKKWKGGVKVWQSILFKA